MIRTYGNISTLGVLSNKQIHCENTGCEPGFAPEGKDKVILGEGEIVLLVALVFSLEFNELHKRYRKIGIGGHFANLGFNRKVFSVHPNRSIYIGFVTTERWCLKTPNHRSLGF
jgi:hypothetical protein